MHPAGCDHCGWRREYDYPSWARRAQERHRCHERPDTYPWDCPTCGQHREYRYPSLVARASLRHGHTAARMQARTLASERRWMAAATAFFGRHDRTEQQWVDRWTEQPELFTDLLRVLGGTPLTVIAQRRCREAALLHQRLADLPLPEQRRVARSDALRARLAELAA